MNDMAEIEAQARARFGLVPRSLWSDALRAEVERLARARGLSELSMAREIVRDPSLLARVVGALTVKESYFFRQADHFRVLVDAARRALALPNAHFCVWSAGCATGEEPYSIALAFGEALPRLELSRVSILATDLDRDAIAAAQTGVYSRWSFREPAAERHRLHFTALPNDRFVLSSEVRGRVLFRHAALQEHLALMPAASLDAVFFRNVSVYLAPDAVNRLYAELARVLRGGGLLFVAATDVRPAPELFRRVAEDATVHRRCVPQHVPGPSSGRTPRETGTPPRTSSAPRAPGAVDVDPAAFYRQRAGLAVARGDSTAAVEDLRRVLYLDPDDTEARYGYALALRDAGELAAARHQLGLITKATSSADDTLRATARALIGELT